MPELPEVETIRKDLEGLICGKEIRKVEVKRRKTIRENVEGFKRSLVGKRVEKIRRRGNN